MRPARVQVSQAELDEYIREKRPEGGTYNIWHHRYSGLERDFNKRSYRPKYKVDIARDSGETVGSRNPNAYFCLFFAKGMCTQGPRCNMWHRIPRTDDVFETTIDCFGRDKFTDFRQDMGGVGGFLKENRTLYVGRIAVTDDVDEVIKRQFGQFGPLERVRILKGRGVAFVTYKTRANAEFAREAMMNQSLENNEIINVRWATSDPNAIANRLDAEDDRRRAAEEAAREEEELIIEFEEEPELPPEPEKKRNVAQAGLQESDSVAKKQKEDEVNGYDYTEEDIENYYDYYNSEQQEQQQYLEQQYQYQYQEEPVKEEGIIPKKVLDNLKTLTKNSPTTITAKTTTNDSLGGLADYGSSDEE
ncbi:hypothetical protein G6F70_007560 [Rhizopus microsporus]|uniref:Pre-mRNA-splicing factor n=2 Tax=Rhizopus TaxID=4842 RepID=A0A367JYR6_RHIAZ|nr:hypothetical protein G6F71_007524 [Rhizopus microsporus]RCH95039.1 Pre-mRNA-splicing factor [Rhizopus azygosporus]KAG1196294.1 hypothetical protein G6F70_007560 [Rhizopus microsporus]KAG1208083.1 hypothetical protein G6F69_007517 [Rhizopus microsporus]KAG1229212.1 hypothetical protein G6F67_007314 [Rhizopus microsporus]